MREKSVNCLVEWGSGVAKRHVSEVAVDRRLDMLVVGRLVTQMEG